MCVPLPEHTVCQPAVSPYMTLPAAAIPMTIPSSPTCVYVRAIKSISLQLAMNCYMQRWQFVSHSAVILPQRYYDIATNYTRINNTTIAPSVRMYICATSAIVYSYCIPPDYKWHKTENPQQAEEHWIIGLDTEMMNCYYLPTWENIHSSN